LESMALSLICLTDGLGLAHVVQSYRDEAYISFTACRDIMPDPEFYSQCLQDSFEQLLAAARAVEGAPAVKPRGKTAAGSPKAKAPKPTKTATAGAKKTSAQKTPKKTAPAKRKPQQTTRKIKSKPAA
ncbi:MAG: DUF1298 domain-containing protein, partial [Erythrobacter sp.]|nr:DUF1298 domain-containing protein [Erythrobacter sp.]